MDCTVFQGIIIGASGGAIAGMTIWLMKELKDFILRKSRTKRIILWLNKEIDRGKEPWRSTHAISSFNNLTENEVRVLCSRSKKICRSSKPSEVWGISGKSRD